MNNLLTRGEQWALGILLLEPGEVMRLVVLAPINPHDSEGFNNARTGYRKLMGDTPYSWEEVKRRFCTYTKGEKIMPAQIDDLTVEFNKECEGVSITGPMGDYWCTLSIDMLRKLALWAIQQKQNSEV